ncbi:Aminoglycoside phosphotransferase [Moelleriella libera RCEF 2490]|uniref:Aminoglycoside phosphotransferase n=1 Tax=Moelleriella libera RCEF 2490 TaxID=1081109 RepID=A0A167W886_9HYPO|nr:Aminoglycoside phosphotransferase [Moelleriella libera RCEF 2490]
MAHHNEESFDRRMTVVRELIRGLGLKDTEVTPVRWTGDRPYPYNNFIYKVQLSTPALAEHFSGAAQPQRQPCTALPPTGGVSTLIVRLSNPKAGGMNNANRVENEVAAMHLARGAVAELAPAYAGVVPAIYAWKAAAGPNPVDETGFGWIMMEYLTGSPLAAEFKSFDMAGKKSVLRGMAAIFSAIQGVKLPPGVDRFGGLTINEKGDIVSGQEALQPVPGGPWPEYADVWKHQLRCELKQADNSTVVRGWQANGIRERIDRFSSGALSNVIRDGGVDMTKLALVHQDFTMGNMLYDPDDKRISGIADFDWAAATHPANEFFFTSLHDIHGSTREQESKKLQQAILTGDFGASADPGEEKHAEAWELAKTWSQAVKECGGHRASDIAGMATLEKLNNFIDLICPWQLGSGGTSAQRSAEQNAKERAHLEKAIDEMLCRWGV